MQSFLINYTEDKIDDLNRRLDATRWPEMPFATGWRCGTNDQVLRDLIHYWRNEYDWFKEQEHLNRLNHLRGLVDGENLHYVHYKGLGVGQHPPLVLLHGWPSSFVEFIEAADLLASGMNGEPGFDIVVPSLPGFVFSEAPRAPGMHAGRIAERIHRLMQMLGFEQYGVSGGDWGAIIGSALAHLHPEAVAGLHVNFVHPASPPREEEEPSLEEQAYLAFHKKFKVQETAYSHIQSTKPQTLAYALQDSPVGLLAWFLEKFWAWSDHADDIWQTFTKDQLLTNVMLYWLPGCVLSASRIYYETFYNMPRDLRYAAIDVPTAYSKFPAEPWAPPRRMVERQYNLIHYSELPKGGHFAAMEQPAIYAENVANFFSHIRRMTD